MKKKKRVLLSGFGILAALCILGAALFYSGYRHTHVFVEDRAYPAHAETLDLRGSGISQDHFEMLSGRLPECRILWDVPFQGKTFPSTTESLQVDHLSQEDVDQLRYFPELKNMDALACRDYEMIKKVLEKRPGCHLSYQVMIGNQVLPPDAEQLRLTAGESSGEELAERLPLLEKLQSIRLEEPEIPAEELLALMDAYPYIHFSWSKTVFGKKLESSVDFLDLSGMKFNSLDEVREQAAYLPGLKQIDMLNCGFANQDMRVFRDQMRSRYKVVWNVQVGTMDLRTDIRDFFPDRDHGKVQNFDTDNLRYCEDLTCVDVGHLGFSKIDWVEGTPHLKYLIMSDGGANDLTPLGQLQELEFLELFMTGVVDTAPLLNCKALRDLNLSRAPLGDITPLTKMTWLEKLWVTHCPLNLEERALLRSSLPDTYIEMDEYFSANGGWRDMPRYFEMRDILRVPYMR